MKGHCFILRGHKLKRVDNRWFLLYCHFTYLIVHLLKSNWIPNTSSKKRIGSIISDHVTVIHPHLYFLSYSIQLVSMPSCSADTRVTRYKITNISLVQALYWATNRKHAVREQKFCSFPCEEQINVCCTTASSAL